MKNELRERNYYGLGESLFDSLFNPYQARQKHNLMRTDVVENENGYELSCEMPGIDKGNVSLEFDDGYLTISVKQEMNEENQEEGKYLQRERFYGSYSRSYYVGEIDRNNIKAKLENGVLLVTLPKTQEIETKKSIEIE